jgi:phosphate uptake regulator
MKRKIIRLGTATNVISLPSKWIRRFSLAAGDELEITEDGNELQIATEKGLAQKKEIKVDFSGRTKWNTEMILTHIYRRGFDRIIAEGLDEEIYSSIRSTVKNLLLGFEITNRSKDSCIVENLAEPAEQKYDVLVRRIFLLISESFECTFQSIAERKYNFSEMEELRSQCDKFILFCRRTVIKESEPDTVLKWELLTHLMHIQHGLFYMYKYMNDNDVKPNGDVLIIFKDLQNYFSMYSESYLTMNSDLLHRIQTERAKYQYGKCLTLIESLKGKNSVLVALIREEFRTIQLSTSPVLAMLSDVQ